MQELLWDTVFLFSISHAINDISPFLKKCDFSSDLPPMCLLLNCQLKKLFECTVYLINFIQILTFFKYFIIFPVTVYPFFIYKKNLDMFLLCVETHNLILLGGVENFLAFPKLYKSNVHLHFRKWNKLRTFQHLLVNQCFYILCLSVSQI